MNETNITETAHPALFPLSALKTKGYAQPELRDDEEVVETDEPGAETA
ncbi:hypothetical protein [Streptomyces sp. NPDC001652]